MWQVIAPGCNGLRHGLLSLRSEIILLRIGPDKERQLDFLHAIKNLCAPERRTFWPGRRITSVGFTPRVTESHRYDGDARLVAEDGFVQCSPVPQTITTAIISRYTAFLDSGIRRLSDDHKPGQCRRTNDRPRAQKKMFCKNRACPNLLQNGRKAGVVLIHGVRVS